MNRRVPASLAAACLLAVAPPGAMTVMVVNKALSGSTTVNLRLANVQPRGSAQVWQLGPANAIVRLADIPVTGPVLGATLPGPSVTLFVIPAQRAGPALP